MLTTDQLKEHVLNRVGYGLGVWHARRYDDLGPEAYLSQQLGQTLEPLALGDADVFINTKLTRSVVARRQLEAVLLDFWFNHFNVNTRGDLPERRVTVVGKKVAQLQNEAIAPEILGNFGAMLLATATSPSMLNYLNNDQNRRPRVLSNGKIVGYNLNYSRELMELHTIGVDGGYDERDVRDAARIMTGWAQNRDGFIFRSDDHDVEEKMIMGVTYPPGGQMEEGQAFLAFLATHPSAATFLSRKLCVRFVGDDPPASAVDAAAATYMRTAGDVGATATSILNDPAFLDAAEVNFRSKVKPPHRFVASALMAMGAQESSHWSTIESDLVRLILDAGDTPYFFGPPTGYPETASYWISPVSMTVRFEIAEAIAYEPGLVSLLRNRCGADGSEIEATFAAIQREFLPGGVSSTTETAIKEHAAANAITSNQRISAIAHLLLASPEFLRY